MLAASCLYIISLFWSLAMAAAAAASHSSDFAFTCERVCFHISERALCCCICEGMLAGSELRDLGLRGELKGMEVSARAEAKSTLSFSLCSALSVNENERVSWVCNRIHFQTNFTPRAPSHRFQRGWRTGIVFIDYKIQRDAIAIHKIFQVAWPKLL